MRSQKGLKKIPFLRVQAGRPSQLIWFNFIYFGKYWFERSSSNVNYKPTQFGRSLPPKVPIDIFSLLNNTLFTAKSDFFINLKSFFMFSICRRVLLFKSFLNHV